MRHGADDHRQERVEVVPPRGVAGGRWTPQIGPETQLLLGNLDLDEASRHAVRDEAAATLAKCVPPADDAGSTTGLVIGFIQSGKTLSYTAVAALARDNGYRMVIVITGVSTLLLEQSTRRLRDDLQLERRPDIQWQLFTNPSLAGDSLRAIRAALDEWRDETVPANEKPTVLVTVMKHHGHLANLTAVLSRLDLQGVPVLVIDDEADQASLNTQVRADGWSTTYRRLLEFRQQLPHHTYLQYTATPQAPLLINLVDSLSPRFVELLTPGPSYTGGEALFGERPECVREIPAGEIPTRNIRFHAAPQSLLQALSIFFVGVAAGMVTGEPPRRRSMMVHPSELVLKHAEYLDWVQAVVRNWQDIMALPEGDPDRQQLLDLFHGAYDDLAQTVPGIPGFDQLVPRLLHALRRVRIHEVNASTGQTPQPNWGGAYAHILVGGQAMDRGYTVEGLTVTYMPRRLGTGNADTVQQRARFFGYRRPYVGYCRIFLEGRVRRAYEGYVEHEGQIHQQLQQCRDQGRSLVEWKRAFFLNPDLRPTRQSVLGLDYIRGNYSDRWYTPNAPHEAPDAVEHNRSVVAHFLGELVLRDVEDAGRRTDMQRHRVANGASLAMVMERLLTQVRTVDARDSQLFTGVLLQISAHLDGNRDATCSVYEMSGGAERVRTLGTDEVLPELFQGEDPNYQTDRTAYPGDARYPDRSPDLAVQVHRLLVKKSDGTVASANVPALAVWVPRAMGRPWVAQPQGG